MYNNATSQVIITKIKLFQHLLKLFNFYIISLYYDMLLIELNDLKIFVIDKIYIMEYFHILCNY